MGTNPGIIHEGNKLYWFIAFFLLYYLIGLTGYGNDSDSYALIKSGQELLGSGVYAPSRTQGALVPEIIIGFLSSLGHHYLTNLVSALLGASSILLFHGILSRILPSFSAALATLIIGLNPYMILASSSTMDYIYSLFFILAGIHFILSNKYFTAAILFALGLSSRLSNVFIVGMIYLYFLIDAYSDDWNAFRKIILTGFAALLITVTFFIPVFIVSGYNFSFLEYGIGNWSAYEFIARYLYKNVALYSLLGSAFIFLSLIYSWMVLKKRIAFGLLTKTALIFFLLIQLMFIKVPVEILYLLPTLFVVIPIYSIIIDSKISLSILLVLTITYSLVNIDILKIEYNADRSEAIKADFGLFFKPGILIDDIQRRPYSEAYYLDNSEVNVNY